MKTLIQKFFIHLLMVGLIGVSFLSCSKDGDGGDSQNDTNDPIIGTWHLRLISNGEDSRDVSSSPCFGDSKVEVDSKRFRITLLSPQEGGQGCSQQTGESEWINRGGVYYGYDEDGEEENLGVRLNDDNQTLQVTTMSDGRTVYLIFRK